MQLVLVDSGDLKAISKALRHHADGKRLRKELVAELKAAGRPLVPKVKAAWLAAPAHKGRYSRSRAIHPDLRKLLADSTWVQARLTGKEAGVRVRSDGRRMPDRMKALGAYAEGIRQRGRWRHPVFGDRDTWAQQPSWPRFYAAAQPDEADARRHCNEAIDKVFDQIEQARG